MPDLGDLAATLVLLAIFAAALRWPAVRSFVKAPERHQRLVALIGVYVCLLVAIFEAIQIFS